MIQNLQSELESERKAREQDSAKAWEVLEVNTRENARLEAEVERQKRVLGEVCCVVARHVDGHEAVGLVSYEEGDFKEMDNLDDVIQILEAVEEMMGEAGEDMWRGLEDELEQIAELAGEIWEAEGDTGLVEMD